MAETFFPAGMTLPAPQPDTGWDASFWEACRRHELIMQQCARCDTCRYPPEVVCYNCRSFDYGWKTMNGKGVVYSRTNVVYPVHPALMQRVPYNVVVVELADDPSIHMLGNVVDCAYEDIRIGMPVEMHFEDHPEEDVTLPLWRRTGS